MCKRGSWSWLPAPVLSTGLYHLPLQHRLGKRPPGRSNSNLWHLIWVAGAWQLFLIREIMFENFKPTLAFSSVFASSLVLGAILAGRRVLHHWWTVWTRQVPPKCPLWEGKLGLLPVLFQRYFIPKRTKQLAITTGVFSPNLRKEKSLIPWPNLSKEKPDYELELHY